MVGLDVVAEGNEGSIYYSVFGQDCQGYIQLMRLYPDSRTEVVRANTTFTEWTLDGYGHLEAFKDGGIDVTDLSTGESHRAEFPGLNITSNELGWTSVSDLVPISPGAEWATYAGTQSDVGGLAPDGRPDRGTTIYIVRTK
jgi:hypothetical protein